MAARWVVVDDTSPDIIYNGSWVADVGSFDSTGILGPPYLSTLHGTNSSAFLAFTFSGTRVRVGGTSIIRNDSGVIDPQWDCFVDGVSIGSPPPIEFAANNWLFCPETPLLNGSHTLTVQVTVTKKQTFWFDRVEYVPSPNLSLANKSIQIPWSDSAIQYDSGWGNFGDTAKGTQQNGAVMTLNFVGVSLTWWGYIPGDFPGNTSTATWQLDDEPAQTFLVKGHHDGAGSTLNVKVFDTPTYAYGSHRLTVIHRGNGQSTPLTLVSLLVRNGTSTSNHPAVRSESFSTPMAAIIGFAVAGAVILVSILLILLLLGRRRTSRRKLAAADTNNAETGPYNVISQTSPISAWAQPATYRSDTTIRGDRLPRPLKFAAEAEPPAVAASAQPVHPHGTLSEDYRSSMLGSSSPTPDPTRMVGHQVSGLGLLQAATETPAVDLPPQYTPS